MKKNHSIILTLSFFLIFTVSSCSTSLSFLNSSVVPAAKGSAKFSKDGNDNYAITVKVTNLAEPSRLQPKKSLYVVWMVTKSNVTKNLGRLNSSSNFFSSGLEGELNSVSAFKPDYVFITAEDNSDIQFPMGTVVLTTKSR